MKLWYTTVSIHNTILYYIVVIVSCNIPATDPEAATLVFGFFFWICYIAINIFLQFSQFRQFRLHGEYRATFPVIYNVWTGTSSPSKELATDSNAS